MRNLTFAVDIDGTITENNQGQIHLEALESLRSYALAGHNVIFVTGRSSIEGYLLAVFGGTTRFCVGENGGCITFGNYEHVRLGNKSECVKALELLQKNISGVVEKKVYPRMTEVVLERTFDIDRAIEILNDANCAVSLTDSKFAFHINSKGVNKGSGLRKAMQMLSVDASDVIAIGDSDADVPLFEVAKTSVALGDASKYVRSKATISVNSKSGEGLLDVMDALGPHTVSKK